MGRLQLLLALVEGWAGPVECVQVDDEVLAQLMMGLRSATAADAASGGDGSGGGGASGTFRAESVRTIVLPQV